jgi:hypothetical protein
MKLKAQDIIEALAEGRQAAGGARLQEGRQGNIIRVADLKYLKEARGKEGMGVRLNEAIASAIEEMSPMFLQEGWDGWDKLADMAHENFVELGEANSSSAFGQLLRAGVQVIANDWYLRTPVSWPEYVQEVSSDKRQEFYAPLHRASLPKLTRPQQPYKEQPISGEDIELINKKFMGGESFEAELWEDDQTGQIRTRAQSLGEAQRIIEEIYVAGRMQGLSNYTVADFVVPASQYQTRNAAGTTITTPFSVNMYTTGSGNRPAAFAQLNTITFKQGMTALMNALDPKGIKILVRPNHLVVSTQDALNVRTLVESDYWPAVQGLSGQTASTATAGGLAGAFAKNVFKGLVSFSVNYFYRDWAWSLMEKKKGPVFQRRAPMSVVQEVPNSGDSFDLDSIRWRSRSRWEFDFVDARFVWLGNDGSVTGLQ